MPRKSKSPGEEAKPKRNRSKKSPTPIGESIEQIAEAHGITTGDHLPAQLPPAEPTLDPLPGSALAAIMAGRDAKVADDRQPEQEPMPPHEANGQLPPWEGPEETWEKRVRGPRQRYPDEPRVVFDAPEAGFQLKQTPQERMFSFRDDMPPQAAEKQALQQEGFPYDPSRKVWAARATPESRDASDKLALKLSGKDQTLARSR